MGRTSCIALLVMHALALGETRSCDKDRICDCSNLRCRCGNAMLMDGCCNEGCGDCAELCAGSEILDAALLDAALLQESLVSEQRAVFEPRATCASHLSCAPCVGGGCAWCISQRACRENEPFQCQGEEDHVSGTTLGHHSQCASGAEVLKDRRERREERAEIARAALLTAQPARSACDDDETASANDDDADASRGEGVATEAAPNVSARPPTPETGADHAGADQRQQQRQKVDPQHRRELERRAQEQGAGGRRPYEVLGVPVSARSSQIRTAYRALSLKFHPDKNPLFRELATAAFGEIAKAFSLLSVPDARQLFDDFGDAQDSSDSSFETFSTQWEFEQYGDATQKAQSFYARDPFIANLDGGAWSKRLGADRETVWLVEFYAPWCHACRQMAPAFKEAARTAAALAEHDSLLEKVEFGAVNCAANAKICNDWYGIRAYPTVLALNEVLGTRTEYFGEKSAAAMLEWAARVAAEWRHLAAHANVRTVATVDDYLALLHSHAFAVVAFSDGLDCQACKTARTNLLRLSASLQGVGNESTRPLIAVVDCDAPALSALCYGARDGAAAEADRQPCAVFLDEVATSRLCHGLPHPPHAPLIKAFAAGSKLSPQRSLGETLYNSNDLEPHLALQIVERVVRLALATLPGAAADNSLATAGAADFSEDEASKEPPPPPPMWNGPPPRQTAAWGLPSGQGPRRGQLGSR